MKLCFDTLVLVAALVVQHPQHSRALQCYLGGLEEGNEACFTTHTPAECYSTLTTMPLQQKIQPAEARELIEETLSRRLPILEINGATYSKAVRRAADLGFRGGMIYDALLLTCAEPADCERIYTFNLKHFKSLEPEKIEVISPRYSSERNGIQGFNPAFSPSPCRGHRRRGSSSPHCRTNGGRDLDWATSRVAGRTLTSGRKPRG
jgi:predicted nucleic acid-binding protein